VVVEVLRTLLQDLLVFIISLRSAASSALVLKGLGSAVFKGVFGFVVEPTSFFFAAKFFISIEIVNGSEEVFADASIDIFYFRKTFFAGETSEASVLMGC